jgi:hypothetical protein
MPLYLSGGPYGVNNYQSINHKLNSGIVKLDGYYRIGSQVLVLVYSKGLNKKYYRSRRIS